MSAAAATSLVSKESIVRSVSPTGGGGEKGVREGMGCELEGGEHGARVKGRAGMELRAWGCAHVVLLSPAPRARARRRGRRSC